MPHKQKGPDQARSWVVAFAACFIYVLVSGINRTTGILYVAIIDTYGVSRLQANLPFTMRNIVKNLAGPVVGVIGQRYGSRGVTIIGGILAALGIILCTFAPSVLWITILWGGMHGLGVALGSTLSQVIVPQYFLKYRATASGFSLSGPCLGSFFLPIVLEYLLTNLGLAGTFLITGGLVLHVVPASIVIVEPYWIRQKSRKLESVGSPSKNRESPIDLTMENHKDIEIMLNKEENFIKSVSTLDVSEKYEINWTHSANGFNNPSFTISKPELLGTKSEEVQVKYMVKETLPKQVPNTKTTTTKDDSTQETSLTKGILRLLQDPMFHLISLSFAAFAMVVDPALTVIVDYLKDKGLKEDVAKYFISLMSLGDLIGRLGFGWVTDKNYISVPKFMMLLHVALGVCFLLLPVFNNFDSLMTILVLYGLVSGVILVMFPILVGKYLQSVQSLAIGFVSFFSGVLNFGIPPLIGYFRDRVGSYDGMFYITGISSIIVGFFWLLEPLFIRQCMKTQEPQNDSSNSGKQ